MKHESLRTLVWGSIFALLTATALAVPGWAQQPPKKPAVQPPAKSATTTTQAAKKPRGRLPAYYGKVVSEKQREEIYKIQAQYNEEIEKLKEQLGALTAKRDSEVEQVLTEEQRAEVAEMKNARRSGGSGKSGGSSKSGGSGTTSGE